MNTDNWMNQGHQQQFHTTVPLPINLAPMADFHHEHEQSVVLHRVDDAVITRTDALHVILARELDATGWMRIANLKPAFEKAKAKMQEAGKKAGH